MVNALKRLVKEEKGQGMTEYGLILGLIAIVVITVMTTMGKQLKVKFNEILVALGGTATP